MSSSVARRAPSGQSTSGISRIPCACRRSSGETRHRSARRRTPEPGRTGAFALVDPARRGRRVEVADVLGLFDGVAPASTQTFGPQRESSLRSPSKKPTTRRRARPPRPKRPRGPPAPRGSRRNRRAAAQPRGGDDGGHPATRPAPSRCSSEKVNFEARHRRRTIASVRMPKTLTGEELQLDDAPRAIRAVPRRQQQPRLPRLLRAAGGARHERGHAHECAARVHEHAVQASHRLPPQGRRRRVGLAGRADGLDDAYKSDRRPMADLLREQFRTSVRSSRRSATATSSSRAGRRTT